MSVKVSILTTCYNHEKYIAQALDGFVMQKTNFPFEVIVHDDASTDGSAQVIREYAQKYPEIIHPIFQTENQYSKGIDIYDKFLFPATHGKYVATCEGDDYWCDENKLQKQVDFMEAHPDYIACAHNTKRLDLRKGTATVLYSTDGERDFAFCDLLAGVGKSFHMSSVMERVTDAPRICSPFTDPSKVGPDYRHFLYLSLQGKIHYFPEVMSVYRRFVPGSWTSRNHSPYRTDILEDANTFLRKVDQLTNYQYTDAVQHQICNNDFNIAKRKFDFASMKAPCFREQYAALSVVDHLKLRLRAVQFKMNNKK